MSFMSDEQTGVEELDAPRAAPGYHALLFENESVRVLHTHVPAGGIVPLHTHRWPAVLHIQRWSDFVRRDEEGAVVMDTRISGGPEEESAIWSGSLGPHTLENVGGAELRVLCVEIKSGHC
jgi:hypothetical protein